MENKTSKRQKKFYRPGKLSQKGTKISIKTQPYINGVIFDLKDPITYFHSYLSTLSLVINQYEFLSQFANIKEITGIEPLDPEGINKLKMLIQFLTLSPIEITLKDQFVDEELADLLELGEKYERQR